MDLVDMSEFLFSGCDSFYVELMWPRSICVWAFFADSFVANISIVDPAIKWF